jgi:hypothetical protein
MRRSLPIALFALALLFATVAMPAAPARADWYDTACLSDRVSIAKDVNFQGARYDLTAGTEWSSMPSGWNDAISSVCVPYRMKIVLYEHANFSGRTFTIEAWNNSRGVNFFNGEGWFNDKTSSLKVSSL